MSADPSHAASHAAAARGIPAWPADSVPSREEAERAVRAVLSGSAGALDPALSARIAAEATELERAAFAAAPDDSNGALRASAALRWRLGAAVLTAPDRGPVDEAAVAELVGDTDAVLGALQASFREAPEPVAEIAATIRKDLVADAMSLTNAVQRLLAPEAAAPAAPRAPEARVLSVVSGELPAEARSRGSNKGLWILLALAIAGAAAWHVDAWTNRPKTPPPAIDGGPAGAIVTPDRGGRTLVVTGDGQPLAADQLEKLRAAQKAKGKRVTEFARGVYAVEPEEGPGKRSP